MNDFGNRLSQNLRNLSNSARNRSGFAYSSLRAVMVPKPKGYRVICIPTVEDRVLQRSLVNYINDGDKCGLQNNVSNGFLPGRSVGGAANAAMRWRKKKNWAYKTDITKFFDSLDRSILKDRLSAVVRATSIHHLLHAAVDCEIEETNSRASKRISEAGISPEIGVRQGMPLSPFFANVMLKDFDASVERENMCMVRYADDLIVLCDSESQCYETHEFFKAELGALGLAVPDIGTGSKTRIYCPDERAEFLGVSLVPNGGGYSLEIGADQINVISDRLLSRTDFDLLLQKRYTLATLLRTLNMQTDGYVATYEYCSNKTQFQQILDSCRDRVISEIFGKLGIDTNALGSAEQRFLGLAITE